MFPSDSSVPEARIGVYRIVRELGAGGMGAVYLGERDDNQFQQTVAIKLVHRGALDEEAVRRFGAERQVLASLDHPHIVHLLDGGETAEGTPYLVMDYVEGVPVDRYCEEHNLYQDQRLELFLQICAAVHYAHQHLIVHCDIKPSNILVTADGQPKLLDFGIAKLLERKLSPESMGMTQGGLRPMTLDAASPEQVRGEQITTATDVYALGIVLYRLLTGRPLWSGETESPAVLMRRILDDEPDPPGLGNELDDILRMALRKEPARRYPSVDHFAADIQRFLTGRPVTARAATRWYVAEKFVRRNRLPVGLAVAMVLTLITGVVTTTRAARIAEQQRARADRRFRDVRQLSQSLFEIHDQIKSLPGSTPARQLLVDRALEYHNSLVKEASDDPGLLEELAEGYLKLGDVQGNPYEANLGDTTGALASYQKALDIVQRLGPQGPKRQQLTARIHNRLSDVLPVVGKLQEAVEHRKKAVAILEASGDAGSRIELAVSYEGLGDQLGNPGLVNLGDRAGALASYRKSLAIWESILTQEPGHARARRATGIQHMKIADLRFQLQDVDGARQDYQQALTVFEGLAGEDQFNVPARRALAMIHRKWGEFLAETGDPAGAVSSLDKARGIVEIIAGADPANTQAQMDVVTVLHSLTQLRQRAGDAAGALATARRGVEILEGLSKADPADKLVRERLSIFLLLAGDLQRPKDLPGGARMISHALDLLKALADEKDATPDRLREYARSLLNYTPQRSGEALGYAERACQATQYREPQFLDTLACLYYESGNRERAMEMINKALALAPPPAQGSKPTALRTQLESHLQQFQGGK